MLLNNNIWLAFLCVFSSIGIVCTLRYIIKSINTWVENSPPLFIRKARLNQYKDYKIVEVVQSRGELVVTWINTKEKR